MKIIATINIFLENGSYEDKSNTYFFKINVCILEMLYFDRIDTSGGTDVNKISESKKCNICHYWDFLDKGFNF